MTAVSRLLGYGAIPVGTIGGGIIGELVGIRWSLVAGGVGLLAGSLPYLIVRVGRLRTISELMVETDVSLIAGDTA